MPKPVTVLTRFDRLLEIFNRAFLGRVVVALLMVQPSKLLKDLCMVWIAIKDSPIGSLSGIVL